MKTRSLFLTLMVLPALLFGQENWESLMSEDFESNSWEDWDMDPIWEVLEENGNHYLHGKDHTWAVYRQGYLWTDYSFKFDFLIKKNTVHVNFRINSQTEEFKRYFLGVSKDGFYLEKQDGESFESFEGKEISIPEDTWHTLEVYMNGNAIQVYLNNTLQIQMYDEEAVTLGTVGFETLDDSEFLFDNIAVDGVKAFKAPEGYEWIRTGGPIGGLGYDIRIHPANKSIMYVTDNPSGINKSTDGGKSWVQKNNGITVRSGASGDAIPIFSLTIDPNNPDVVWSGTQEVKGIFKSTDGGDSWEKMDDGVEEGDELSIRGFAIHPENSDVVFAAGEISTNQNGIEFNKTKGVIYKTVDGGIQWYAVWRGDNLARVVLFNFLQPDTLYCSTGIFDREAYNSDIENGVMGGVGVLRSHDGGETWEEINNGIDNLYVGFLEMHPENPDILFAASSNNATGYPPNNSYGGIYKTENGGDNWEKVISRNENYGAVTVSKSNPDVVYAIGSSVYRSKDGGLTWEQQDAAKQWGPPGINPGFVISAVVDPEDPDLVWVNNYGGGNFVSTDHGATWENSSMGYTGANLRDVAINPSDPNVCYVAGRSGPFVTRNGGEQWEGMNEQRVLSESYNIDVFPDNDLELFSNSDGSGILFKSENGGASWKEVFRYSSADDSGPYTRYSFRDVAISCKDPDVVYAGMGKVINVGMVDPSPEPSPGMFKSADRGISWNEINDGLESCNKIINAIAIHPDDPDIVYIGTYLGGVYKSDNGGTSWQAMNNGLTFSDVRALAIDPLHPDTVYAGSGNGKGLAISRDGGQNWSDEVNKGIKLICPVYLSPYGKAVEGMDLSMSRSKLLTKTYSVPWTKMLDIVIDPTNTKKIYVADISAGVYFSQDGGDSWSLITDGMEIKSVNCLSISRCGEVLYCGTEGGGVYCLSVKNQAPHIYSRIPFSDTVRIYHGEDVDFEFFSSDLNRDTLGYQWYLDDETLADADNTVFSFRTGNYEIGDYVLKALVHDDSASSSVSWNIQILELPSSVSDEEAMELYRVYPNPFGSEIIVSYFLEEEADVQLSISDLQARRLGVVSIENSNLGYNQFTWNVEHLNQSMRNAGVYILNLVIQNEYGCQSRHFKILKLEK